MEIGTAAGGALLSVPLEKLLDMLASPELRPHVNNREVQSELHKWETMLPKIHAVLEDAEHKQATTRPVKIWLSELTGLVYDVEDALDELAREAFRVSQIALFTNGIVMLHGLRIQEVEWLRQITARLEAICTQMINLGLGDDDNTVGGRGGRSESTTRTPSTSVFDSHIFGRDKDKQAVLDLLLADGDVAAGDGVSVIPILGMGGLGKTTLAQQLYNDEKVKAHFQLGAWVCVSDSFDILGITKTILQCVGRRRIPDGKYVDELQVELEEMLSKKRFFIVLDDVWNEKDEDWTSLCKPFRGAAPGSKIIVTTRNQNVADLVGSTLAYRLGVLSSGDCLSLFAQHALGATNFDGHQDLKDIGLKIVEKCKGLPLAAKTLGGLLQTKLQPDEWKAILESQIWDLPEDGSGILRSLRLSYHHLPSQLKQCFAYCAIFPKDYIFNKDELVLLWMAEGFLSHPKSSKRLEDVGAQYFSDLLSRSFFQPLREDSGEFVMHDLIHDLAQDVAGEICFHLECSVENREHLLRDHLPTLRTRHSSFSQPLYDVSRRFNAFDRAKGLRTLLALPPSSGYAYLSIDRLNNLLPKLGNLRALSLHDYGMRVVPDSVIRLKHLRYLNLSETAIRFLPEFVCYLWNLQTLLLKNCSELEKLPEGIAYIPNLCHLDIRETDKLKEMPPGIGNLTEIRTLGKFSVGLGKVDGLNIRELKNLLQLKGELCLEELHNVEKPEDAREADLKGKEGLQGLVMRWSDNMDDHMLNGSVETNVIELLQPHRNVERLAIEFYYGLEFPSWLGDPLLSNMTKIELCNCKKSTSLPSLGRLPMLKHLIIKGMSAVRTLGFEFFGCESGGFPALETLQFEDMQAWEKWCSVGTTGECGFKFPRLHTLLMKNCPVLVGECLVSLPSLRTLILIRSNESFIKCMADIGSLTTLSISEMSGISCLHDSFGQLLAALENLWIFNCKHLVSLWQSEVEIEDGMTNLKKLEVRRCLELVSLITRATISKMTSLEKMIVRDCPKIGSIQIDQQERNGEVKFPPKLKHLLLDNCGDQFMEFLGNGVVVISDDSVLVDYLEIKGCDGLQHLAIKSKRGGVKVKQMRIEDCRNLVSLSYSYEITSKLEQEEDGKERLDDKSSFEIEELMLSNCPSLSDGSKFLDAVWGLLVRGCSQLKTGFTG